MFKRELKNILYLRYQAILESPTDSLFYQNIHAYIDVIVKNPGLYAIIQKAEKEYSEKHYDIWKVRSEDEDVIDERSRQTYKSEKFNLYTANFVELFVRIYLPIEDYKKSNEQTSKQHPNALLMLYGIESSYVKEWICNVTHRSWPTSESKRRIKTINRWYDKKHRDHYEKNLKQFHSDFLTILLLNEEANSVASVKEEIPIALSPRTGDFSYKGKTGTVTPSSQEFKVLNTLLNSPERQATYLDLIQSYRPFINEATKSQKADLYKVMNKLRNTLEIKEGELIENVPKVGYRLTPRQIGEKED